MKKDKIDNFKERINKLADDLSAVCSDLHFEADKFYENGEMYDKLSSFALEIDNISEDLRRVEMRETATQLRYRNLKAIFDVGDLVYFINDGLVCCGTIKSIQRNGTSVCGHIIAKIDNNTSATVSNKDIISGSMWYWLEREVKWNSLVNKLKNNGKTLKLKQQKDKFSVIVNNGDGNIVYSCGSLVAKDFIEIVKKIEAL